MLTDKNFKKLFPRYENPSEQKPWLTVWCDDKVDEFFLDYFVDSLDNVPRMRDEDHPLLFRGQSDAGWTLTPKLYRLWLPFLSSNHPVSEIKEQALQQELDSIYYFQERVFPHLPEARYLKKKLDFYTIGEWLSLMQHYKSPTRFLDWTTSIYVALFFAVNDNDDKEGAVWHFGNTDLVDAMEKQTKKITESDFNRFLKGYKPFVEYGMNAQRRIEIYGSDLKTDRMMLQRGVFTFSHEIFSDHAFDIGIALLSGKVLIKIVIPAAFKRSIRRRLFKMNITTETLFPCIDSVGQSIHEKILLYQDAFLKK